MPAERERESGREEGQEKRELKRPVSEREQKNGVSTEEKGRR